MTNAMRAVEVAMVLMLPICIPKYILAMQINDPSNVPTNTMGIVRDVGRKVSS